MSSAIGRRYAKALFELALESKSLPKIEAQLDDLENAINENVDFSAFLQSPLVAHKDQDAIVLALAKKAKFSEILTNTLRVMVAKGRLNLVPEMIDAFRELAIESRETFVAEVTSAKALTKTQEKKLADTLQAKLGKAVAIESKIDESLIGGLVVKIGSTMIDSSIKGRLSKLHNAMKEVG